MVKFIIAKEGMLIESNNKSYPIYGKDGNYPPFQSLDITMDELGRLELIIREIFADELELKRKSTPCVGGWI